jgi:hypothetical protein
MGQLVCRYSSEWEALHTPKPKDAVRGPMGDVAGESWWKIRDELYKTGRHIVLQSAVSSPKAGSPHAVVAARDRRGDVFEPAVSLVLRGGGGAAAAGRDDEGVSLNCLQVEDAVDPPRPLLEVLVKNINDFMSLAATTATAAEGGGGGGTGRAMRVYIHRELVLDNGTNFFQIVPTDVMN